MRTVALACVVVTWIWVALPSSSAQNDEDTQSQSPNAAIADEGAEMVYFSERKTWREARSECMREFGELVGVKSEVDQRVVMAFARSHAQNDVELVTSVWVDGHSYSHLENNFKLSGTPADAFFAEEGLGPSNSEVVERCVSIELGHGDIDDTHLWTARPCHDASVRLPFICALPPAQKFVLDSPQVRYPMDAEARCGKGGLPTILSARQEARLIEFVKKEGIDLNTTCVWLGGGQDYYGKLEWFDSGSSIGRTLFGTSEYMYTNWGKDDKFQDILIDGENGNMYLQGSPPVWRFGGRWYPTHKCLAVCTRNKPALASPWQYISSPASWLDAESTCRAYGGHLASVHSAEEDHMLAKFVEQYRSWNTPATIWIGGSKSQKTTYYSWSDNSGKFWPEDQQSNVYTNLPGGAETTENDSRCLQLHFEKTSNVSWNVAECTDMLPFVCEKHKRARETILCDGTDMNSQCERGQFVALESVQYGRDRDAPYCPASEYTCLQRGYYNGSLGAAAEESSSRPRYQPSWKDCQEVATRSSRIEAWTWQSWDHPTLPATCVDFSSQNDLVDFVEDPDYVTCMDNVCIDCDLAEEVPANSVWADTRLFWKFALDQCGGKQSGQCLMYAGNVMMDEYAGFEINNPPYIRVRRTCSENILLCENEEIPVVCPVGKTIKVYDATFGRSGEENRCAGSDNATECASSTALTFVKDLCEGRRACWLKSEKSTFGDACGESLAYLRVHYHCIKTESPPPTPMPSTEATSSPTLMLPPLDELPEGSIVFKFGLGNICSLDALYEAPGWTGFMWQASCSDDEKTAFVCQNRCDGNLTYEVPHDDNGASRSYAMHVIIGLNFRLESTSCAATIHRNSAQVWHRQGAVTEVLSIAETPRPPATASFVVESGDHVVLTERGRSYFCGGFELHKVILVPLTPEETTAASTTLIDTHASESPHDTDDATTMESSALTYVMATEN